MNDLSVWDSIVQAFEDLIDQVVAATPKILAAIAVMAIGVIVASILAKITRKLLGWVERNKFVRTAVAAAGLAGNLSRLAGKFVYWAVFLIFLSAAITVLDLQSLSETVDKIVGFLPALFSAAFVFFLAYFGSVVLRDLVVSSLKEVRFAYHRVVGIVVQTFIIVFGVVTAAAQLGLDVTLVTNNITVIVAGFVLAFAIAFGLGGRSMAGSFVTGLVTKDQLTVGQKVAVEGGVSGKVKAINATSVVLDTKEGDMMVSFHSLVK